MEQVLTTRWMIGRGRIIFDLRGPCPYETLQRLGYKWPNNLPAAIQQTYDVEFGVERLAAAKADHIFTVSPGLKKYALEQLNQAAEKVTIIPSCVSGLAFNKDHRSTFRKLWGVSRDEIVLLYAGKLGTERLPEHMFQLFRLLLDQQPRSKMILLTYRNEIPHLSDLAQKQGIPPEALIVEMCSRSETIARMSGADIGMIFCESAKRYESWFPIKFPEYLSAGLSLIINDEVGDLTQLVRERQIGWIINPRESKPHKTALIESIIKEMNKRDLSRNRSLQTCEDLFLWQHYIPSIRQAYQQERGSR